MGRWYWLVVLRASFHAGIGLPIWSAKTRSSSSLARKCALEFTSIGELQKRDKRYHADTDADEHRSHRVRRRAPLGTRASVSDQATKKEGCAYW